MMDESLWTIRDFHTNLDFSSVRDLRSPTGQRGVSTQLETYSWMELEEAAVQHQLSRLFSTVDKPNRKFSFALDVNHSARFADKIVVDQVIGFLRDLD